MAGPAVATALRAGAAKVGDYIKANPQLQTKVTDYLKKATGENVGNVAAVTKMASASPDRARLVLEAFSYAGGNPLSVLGQIDPLDTDEIVTLKSSLKALHAMHIDAADQHAGGYGTDKSDIARDIARREAIDFACRILNIRPSQLLKLRAVLFDIKESDVEWKIALDGDAVAYGRRY